MKSFAVALLGLFCFVYLLNPGAGLFELIPDNLPLIGNLDEATAVATLYMCLNYFGFSFSRFRRQQSQPTDRDCDDG